MSNDFKTIQLSGGTVGGALAVEAGQGNVLLFNLSATVTVYMSDDPSFDTTDPSDNAPLPPNGTVVYDGSRNIYIQTQIGQSAQVAVIPGGVNFFQFVELITKTLIINAGSGNGLFVYSGVGMKGNPPIAEIAPPGAMDDPYGNPITPNAFALSGLPLLLYNGALVAALASFTGSDIAGNTWDAGYTGFVNAFQPVATAFSETSGIAWTTPAGINNSVTTASYTPIANALQVAIVAAGNGGNALQTATAMSDSVAGTWKKLASVIGNNAGVGIGVAEVWCKDAGATPAAQTVTWTLTPGGVSGIGMLIREFPGAALAASQPGTIVQDTFPNTAPNYVASITPGTTGSQVVGAFARSTVAVTLTPNTNTTDYAQSNGSDGDSEAAFEAAFKSTANAQINLGYTNLPVDGSNVFAMAEIKPASAAVLTPEGWHPAAALLGSGWAAGPTSGNGKPLFYRINANNELELYGAIHSTSATPAATALTLPAGWIPPTIANIGVIKNVGGTISSINININNSTGAVQPGPAIAAASTDIYFDNAVPMI